MEEWRIINGFEDYAVSNLGNVKNVNTGLILKPGSNGKGYLHVGLYKNHKAKSIMIHKLVALAFIPNPDGLPQVNHKDENKENNCVGNLEWCTSEYNINYGTHNYRTGLNNPNRKPICSIDSLGNIIEFESARDATRYYEHQGMKVDFAGICKALKRQTDTYKNLAWFYLDDEDGKSNYCDKFSSKFEKRKFINCTDKNGNTTHFGCMAEALRKFNLKPSQRKYIKQALLHGIEFLDMTWNYDVVTS